MNQRVRTTSDIEPEPIFDVPPHLEHPAGVRMWFVEPIGVVTQFHRATHIDLDISQFFSGRMDDQLRDMAPTRDAKVHYVHDWRRVSSYDSAARKHLIDWGVRVRNSFSSLVIVIPEEAPTLVRMGVSVASTSMALVGVNLRMEHDIHEVVRRMALRPHPLA